MSNEGRKRSIGKPPAVTGVLETCLYADDLERTARFYEDLFGFSPMDGDARLRAYGVAQGSVLLIFQRGTTGEEVQTPGGVIPPHDGQGQLHIAFAIPAAEWDAWKQCVEERGIVVERIVKWPRGGQSLYFRDPDGNLVELATPGLWKVY